MSALAARRVGSRAIRLLDRMVGHDRIAASLAVLLGAALVLPFALGVAIPGRADLGYHASLIESQHAAWRSLGRPSPFVSGLGGSERFFPLLAVYGGPAYGLVALLRVVLSLQATVGVLLGAAWAGLSWGTYRCARAASLTPQLSLLLAVIVVASSQSIDTIYSRMAVAEIVAVSAVAVLAGSTSTLWAGRERRPGCVPLAIASGFVLAGGHPLTLVWSAVTATIVGLVVVVTMRPTLALRSRWPWLLPGAAGMVLATPTWPMAVAVLGSTRVPDARDHLVSAYFFEPFGVGSAGRVVELLNPLRPSVGPGQLAPYRPAVPALLVLVLGVLLVVTRRDPARRPRTAAASACLALAAAVMVLPQSRWLTTMLWPIATMQYHWRIYTYVAAFVVAAAVVVLGRLGPTDRRLATRLLTMVACIELAVGAAQVTTSHDQVTDPVRSSDIAELVELAPSPVHRNDAEMLRSESLPVVPAARFVRHDGASGTGPEAEMVISTPLAGRFAIPVVSAPPIVSLSDGFRAVGWTPAPRPAAIAGREEGLDGSYEGRPLWLVVENFAGSDTLVVGAAPDGPTGLALRALGPATALMLLLVAATSADAAVRTGRRVAGQRRRRVRAVDATDRLHAAPAATATAALRRAPIGRTTDSRVSRRND